jgi:hypothetical protein
MNATLSNHKCPCQAAIFPCTHRSSRRQWTVIFITWSGITLPLESLLQLPPLYFAQLLGQMKRKRRFQPRVPLAKLRSFRVRNGSRDDDGHHLCPVGPWIFHIEYYAPSPIIVDRAIIQDGANTPCLHVLFPTMTLPSCDLSVYASAVDTAVDSRLYPRVPQTFRTGLVAPCTIIVKRASIEIGPDPVVYYWLKKREGVTGLSILLPFVVDDRHGRRVSSRGP